MSRTRASRTNPVWHGHAITWQDAPWSKEGHSCDKCGEILKHADLVGKQEGNLFRKVGYRCPACKHSNVDGVKDLQPFDWKRLMT